MHSSRISGILGLLGALLLPAALAQNAPPPSPVQVTEVEKTIFVPTVDIVGTIYSRNNVKLTAGVGGRLDYVAEPGTFLVKGEEVARIDPLPLQLQQAEQEANIKRARINLEYLNRELNRLKELRLSNSASVFQLDQTQSQYDLAQADLEIAQVRLNQINDQLSRSVVKAPFDGVVTERLREAGSDVSRAEVLVNMLDTENLEGRVFIPVKYLPFLRTSKEVVIASETHQLSAQIKAIIPAADVQSQSFELRVSLPASANRDWTSGQLIKATIPVRAPQETLTVHRDALILRSDGTFVVVIDEENKAHRHAVEVGEGQRDKVSISSDAIQAGDRVATRGAERLRDGQSVVIATPNA
ncbi:MAG: efflux RND transporter periplasmic adaptor subunit [Aestuariibacter sp.]